MFQENTEKSCNTVHRDGCTECVYIAVLEVHNALSILVKGVRIRQFELGISLLTMNRLGHSTEN